MSKKIKQAIIQAITAFSWYLMNKLWAGEIITQFIHFHPRTRRPTILPKRQCNQQQSRTCSRNYYKYTSIAAKQPLIQNAARITADIVTLVNGVNLKIKLFYNYHLNCIDNF